MRLVVKYQQNPLRCARALAYVHVAMHDAWLHGSRAAPAAPPGFAELAAHRAASLAIEQLYANETPGQFEAQYAGLAHGLALHPRLGEPTAAIGRHVVMPSWRAACATAPGASGRCTTGRRISAASGDPPTPCSP